MPANEFRIEFLVSDILALPKTGGALTTKSMVCGRPIDIFVSCGYWHQLNFTEQEISQNKVNILNHFAELIPSEGKMCGLITVQNGIATEFPGLQKPCEFINELLPEKTLLIGFHNPTVGLTGDLSRLAQELNNIEDTPTVIRTRQFFSAIISGISKVNSQVLWKHIAHSEGGLVGRRSIEGMTPEEKALLRQHLIYLGLGPAMAMPKSYALSTRDVYSVEDKVTKRYSAHLVNDKNYNVVFVPCTSASNELFLGADHGILGTTYKTEITNDFKKGRDKHGFYKGNTR
jgi:hypothetical protein